MRVSDTSAMPVGWRSRVPEKMTSSIREPRKVLADCSPNTHEMASAIFDLPQPLGPMMAATPSPGNFSSVRSQKDLKPRIWSFFSLSNFDSFDAPSLRTSRDDGPIYRALASCAGWGAVARSGWLDAPDTLFTPV